MTKSYFLSNDNSNQNNAADLAPPNWFCPKIDAKKIRALMEKSDARALMDTILWLGAMLGFATIAIALWPSWWSAPFWLAYGVLYGSASDSRWHECGHKTAFKTAWMNNIVYHIASFMLSPSPMVWRASHVRHHTDTIIVGRDPEIIAMRPPHLFRILVNVFGILDAYHLVLRMALHASGRIDPQEATYIRPQDHGKVFLVARIWVLIYA